MSKDAAQLLNINPDRIKPNPNNPRLIFREEELQSLRESIRSVGIQVPLTVYQERNSYHILDGERRWRCARKLNLHEVPVIVQPKPEPLENLLKMFNIHNVRVEWDTIATALKLGEVKELLKQKGDPGDIKRLASLTGLSKPMVRNCIELLELPKKYIDMLLEEATKPKSEQKITPDLFIEIYKSQRVVQSYAPEVFEDVTPKQYVETMVKKYQDGVVKSVVDYRDVSKIARGERSGVERERIIPIIKNLLQDKTYTVQEAFDDSVKEAYDQRDIATRAGILLDRLTAINRKSVTAEMRDMLRRLRKRIDELL